MLKLKEYCEYISLGVKKAKKNQITYNFWDEKILNDDTNWYSITMKSIKHNRIENVYSFEKNREYMKYMLQKGDIIISRFGPNFNSTIFDNAFPYKDPNEYETKVQVVAIESVIFFSLNKYIDPYYVLYILNLDETKKYLQEKGKGTKIKSVNITDILNIDIPEYNDEWKKLTEKFKKNLYNNAKLFIESSDNNYLAKEYKNMINNILQQVDEVNRK